MSMSACPFKLRRRTLLKGAFMSAVGAVLSAHLSSCASSSERQRQAEPDPSVVGRPSTNSKVLLVYFSRAGENYFYDNRTDLAVGNTEVLAGMISQRITCDVYHIAPVQPYPHSY